MASNPIASQSPSYPSASLQRPSVAPRASGADLSHAGATRQTPSSRVNLAGGSEHIARDPRKATSLGRSVLFAIGGLCAGTLTGAAITMLIWNGVKDRFSSGVSTTAAGQASAQGEVAANGDFGANGDASMNNIDAEIIGWQFGVPASGSASYDATGDMAFNGQFNASNIDMGFDGDAAVDVGSFAPWKVIVSVAAIFGIVVGAFAWLCERQLAAGEDRKAILEHLDAQKRLSAAPVDAQPVVAGPVEAQGLNERPLDEQPLNGPPAAAAELV